MTQQLTNRVKAIKNDPGTGELAQISEINAAFDKFDNHFVPSALMIAANQTLTTGVYSNADFTTTTHDTYAGRGEGAMADLVNNQIIIRKAGLYLITGQTSFAANNTGTRRLAVMLNAVDIISDEDTGEINGVVLNCSVVRILAVNDSLTMRIRQASGGNLLTDPNLSTQGIHLSATWLGAAVEV